MRKSKIVLFSMLLLSSTLPLLSTAQAADEPAVPAQPQAKPHSYEVKDFYSDSVHFTMGDVVPDLYRTKKYEITEWQKRHLPPPEEGSHWTYMGGNYVLISNDEGKLLKAESGDILYQ